MEFRFGSKKQIKAEMSNQEQTTGAQGYSYLSGIQRFSIYISSYSVSFHPTRIQSKSLLGILLTDLHDVI